MQLCHVVTLLVTCALAVRGSPPDRVVVYAAGYYNLHDSVYVNSLLRIDSTDNSQAKVTTLMNFTNTAVHTGSLAISNSSQAFTLLGTFPPNDVNRTTMASVFLNNSQVTESNADIQRLVYEPVTQTLVGLRVLTGVLEAVVVNQSTLAVENVIANLTLNKVENLTILCFEPDTQGSILVVLQGSENTHYWRIHIVFNSTGYSKFEPLDPTPQWLVPYFGGFHGVVFLGYTINDPHHSSFWEWIPDAYPSATYSQVGQPLTVRFVNSVVVAVTPWQMMMASKNMLAVFNPYSPGKITYQPLTPSSPGYKITQLAVVPFTPPSP